MQEIVIQHDSPSITECFGVNRQTLEDLTNGAFDESTLEGKDVVKMSEILTEALNKCKNEEERYMLAFLFGGFLQWKVLKDGRRMSIDANISLK